MPTPTDLDQSVFVHVRIVLGMVVSLSIAKLLSGLVAFVQHPGRRRAWWVHQAWAVAMLLHLVAFWWWQYGLSHVHGWRFETYAFLLLYAVLNYTVCAVLFPDDIDEYDGYRGYFLSRRYWFFGLLAAIAVVDGVDTLIKGQAHLQALGPEYPVRQAGTLLLCALAMALPRPRVQAVLVLVYLGYQLSWVLRLYDVLS